MKDYNKQKENQEKVSNLNNALRQMKIEFKQLKEEERAQDEVVKRQHEQISLLEEKNKKYMKLVKDAKEGKTKPEQSS
jgi:hypothetical protein